ICLTLQVMSHGPSTSLRRRRSNPSDRPLRSPTTPRLPCCLLEEALVHLDVLDAASDVPWAFNFIASTPVEPIGPALTIAYHPKTTMLFVGGGIGASRCA